MEDDLWQLLGARVTTAHDWASTPASLQLPQLLHRASPLVDHVAVLLVQVGA